MAASCATSARTRSTSFCFIRDRTGRSGGVANSNVRHPDHPRFQDFGDMVLRGDRGLGYVRLDWFTPDGLGTWGDGRLFILGTDGYIEVRKYIDVAMANRGTICFWWMARGRATSTATTCPCRLGRSSWRYREPHACRAGSGRVPAGRGTGAQGAEEREGCHAED